MNTAVSALSAGADIALPFGGLRKSGHGRETGFAALHEFSKLETVALNHV